MSVSGNQVHKKLVLEGGGGSWMESEREETAEVKAVHV